MKTFGELTRDEKIALFTAWVDDKTIEYHCKTKWLSNDRPAWHEASLYRIAVTPNTINWDHVAPEFVAMATDWIGTYLYRGVPTFSEGGEAWRLHGSDAADALPFASFRRGTVAPADSLVLRPVKP